VVGMMRHLMLNRYPQDISPLQVRWQKADKGFLSAQNGRDSTSISVSGEIGRDYVPFLKAVDKELQRFEARPHWGKLHFLDADRARRLYPYLERFQQIRRAMDPSGRFLNEHLRNLFE
jgi:FAD/FMN-containing dehydrogenase